MLRHLFHHGTDDRFNLHVRYDVRSAFGQQAITRDNNPNSSPHPPLPAVSREVEIERLTVRTPSVVEYGLASHRAQLGESVAAWSDSQAWTVDTLAGPDPTDKSTVLTLAKVASDAYVPDPSNGEWWDVGGGFNRSLDFGWKSQGLRGHIFTDEDNSTVIIGLKGTSPSVFDGAETTTNDKINDNLLFSCCCAQGGQYFWRQVCDGMTGTFKCNQTAIIEALQDNRHYYQAALELYSNVTEIYPDANVWLSGHSLGGAVSSLLGLTYGLPAFTYESPPEAMAARRLGLPLPPSAAKNGMQSRNDTQIYHFGHTADPIFMGVCNGATSACTLGGYAMESSCHAGNECIYDVVADLGWRVGVGTHSINNVIRDVIEKYETVPKCKKDTDCVDCFNWKYYESHGDKTSPARPSTTTTTTTTTSSQTSTEICKTPGWWGCLDKSTTSYASVTSTFTTTVTSTTCLSPGWFGCKVESTTTLTATTTTREAILTTTITLASSVTAAPRATVTATAIEL